MATREFTTVCEIEPATQPDLTQVRLQIATLSRVADAFLIPDNHIGRATVSSIAVAHEVALMGGRAIACINARDRNVLGFQRDLLTASAYGVSEFLFVYGDRPEWGSRSDDLTVRAMLAEARRFAERTGDGRRFRVGVTSGLVPLPAWKLEADFLFAQVSFSAERLVEWRSSIRFAGPVSAGVLVVPSVSMARKLSADIPQLAVPAGIIDRLDAGASGVDIALELIREIRASGAFDGVHLIPVNRHREMARRLEEHDWGAEGGV
jgi:methylenetetrahydrofolate reductase (NADPH)